MVFAPEQYDKIYDSALKKANINLTEITDQGQRIDILLHDMLDYAGDVVNFVTESVQNHN